jgi:4'-phosphopantetheinyl transferase
MVRKESVVSPSKPEPQRGGDVHVRYLTLGHTAALCLPAMIASLPTLERERASSFALDSVRLQFVAARVLLRASIADCLGVAREAVSVSYDSRGRPVIVAPNSLVAYRISLSHTEGMVACAFARSLDVGVDVERDNPRRDTLALEDVCLHREERSVVERLPPALRRRSFFAIWTLKEAYSKALGIGLALPFERVRMLPDATGVVRNPLKEDGSPLGSWLMRVWQLSAEHCLGLAAGSDNRHVRLTRARLGGAGHLLWS